MFLDFATCGCCGFSITGERQVKKSGLQFEYYRCTYKNKRQPCTERTYVRAERFAAEVQRNVELVSLPDEWKERFLARIETWEGEDSGARKERAEKLKTELAVLKAKLDRVNGAFADGDLDMQEFRELKNPLVERKIELDGQIANLQDAKANWIEPLKEWILEANTGVKLVSDQNWPEMKATLRKVGLNRLLRDQTLTVTFKKPWDLLAKTNFAARERVQKNSLGSQHTLMCAREDSNLHYHSTPSLISISLEKYKFRHPKTRLYSLTFVLTMFRMASVWRHPKSKYWSACWTERGRRMKRSTKETDRKKAMQTAVSLEKAAVMAERGALTEASARNILADIFQTSTGQRLNFYTVRAWFDYWLLQVEEGRAAGSYTRYQSVSNRFLGFLGERSESGIETIRPDEIASFRASEVESGRGATTANANVKTLGVAFGLAKRHGIITTDPTKALTPLRKTQKGGGKEPFTMEEVKALVAEGNNGDKEWKTLILCAFYLGGRLQTMATLRWSNIDLAKKTASFRERKTGLAMTIPLHPTLESHLLSLTAPDADAPLMPRIAAMPSSGRSGRSEQFKKLMARAGVTAAKLQDGKGAGHDVYSKSFHSLRRSFVTEQANAGVDIDIRKKLAGHASDEMSEHYTSRDIATLRKGIDSLPNL